MQNKKKLVIILLLATISMIIIPLAVLKNTSFSGADSKASSAISEITGSEYKPWFNPVIKLPGPETETLLFCLQSAIGAGIIGFGFGVLKERKKWQKKLKSEEEQKNTEEKET